MITLNSRRLRHLEMCSVEYEAAKSDTAADIKVGGGACARARVVVRSSRR
mgnify:CR=1 FL=1